MRTITSFMTFGSVAASAEHSVDTADRLMSEHRIRHLPVLQNGVVVGEVSQRDIAVWRKHRSSDEAARTPIAHIMIEAPYTVDAGAGLAETASTMADRKIGSAVVIENGRLVGIFTVVDALRALATLAEE